MSSISRCPLGDFEHKAKLILSQTCQSDLRLIRVIQCANNFDLSPETFTNIISESRKRSYLPCILYFDKESTYFILLLCTINRQESRPIF